MGRPVIVSACRSPIGRFLGGLSSIPAPKLGALAVKEALQRAGVAPDAVDEVIMGCVLQAGLGQNPARQALIHAGIPNSVGAFTVNKVCGSGLKSVMLAAQAIKAGDARTIVAGGMESMSRAPYYLPEARTGVRLNHGQLLDGMVADGLWDVYNDFHMGMTGELVAEKYEVTREQMDAWAAQSQARAVAAEQAGRFDAERFKVEVPGRKGEVTVVSQDEGPRADTTLASLAKLKPVFKKDGTVTAGNASTINDGSSALVVMDSDEARSRRIAPLATITGYATGGMAPEWVMMAPTVAVEKVCALTGVRAQDYDLIELNEAFAVQSVALARVLDLDPEKVNVNGGAVALGHPIGCSGARILTTLIHALRQRNLTRGLAGLCLGGGNAVALTIEMEG
ncbi:MAG: acetyl-CoA C-acetyltransferase [Planctomycetes bacterium]|nr:acetyl-CoA C-acetyltransferase [Planctomycetota bacterium]